MYGVRCFQMKAGCWNVPHEYRMSDEYMYTGCWHSGVSLRKTLDLRIWGLNSLMKMSFEGGTV